MAKKKGFDNLAVWIGILLVFFVLAYWVPLKALVSTWWHNDDYSYGFLIPLISLYLFWDKRAVIRTLSVGSSWAVFPLLLLLVFISLFGVLGSSSTISITALPILIILFSAFIFGIRAVRKLILPLGILVFMIPVPPIIEYHFSVFLKLISSAVGGKIIELLNIPVHVSGNVIDLGTTQLQVVDACSGMRFLFPLIALGILSTYFFEKVMWKRIVCAMAAIPIGILINALRIATTGILVNFWGTSLAEGFFHDFTGGVFFIVALAFLFLVSLILRKLPPKEPPGTSRTSTEGSEFASVRKSNINPAFYTSVLTLAIVGALTWSTGTLPPIKIKGGIQSFPLVIGAWEGRSESVDAQITEKSGAEESFYALYKQPGIAVVTLYMGYRSSAFLDNENFFHSPTICLPSQGWATEVSTHLIHDVHGLGRLKVSKIVAENMGTRDLVYFWFQTKDKTSPDKDTNRFDLTMHAIVRNNTYDLFIRPVTRISPNEATADAEKRMDGFVRDMVPTLVKFLSERQYEEKK